MKDKIIKKDKEIEVTYYATADALEFKDILQEVIQVHQDIEVAKEDATA